MFHYIPTFVFVINQTLMLHHFKQYITDHQLFQPSERILLAVSGGIDSVCLAHLFQQTDYPFGIAHCNFQLRGEAADQDVIFVKSLAEQYQVSFFETSFDTQKISQESKKGIQETARDLRYEWLEDIRGNNNFDYIATAHHLNDSIETALFNFSRGGGIRAVRGMLNKKHNIVRPLLFASKQEIENYAHQHQLAWRTDASNAQHKYTRNYIRHQVIPALKKVHPNLEANLSKSLAHLKAAEQLYDWSIEHIKQAVFSQTKDVYRIDMQQLHAYPAASTVLYELLKTFDFTSSDVAQILESRVGSLFENANYEALLDRKYLLIRTKKATKMNHYFLPEDAAVYTFEDVLLETELLEVTDFKLNRRPTVAQFDYEKLSFPLTIRTWQDGDFFRPLGMNGQRKKVQDFFSDQKVNRWQKNKSWLLESDNEIAWVMGYRISESFKVDEHTKMVYRIRLLE